MKLKDAIKIVGDNYSSLSEHDKKLSDKMQAEDDANHIEASYIECVYMTMLAEQLLTGTYRAEDHEPKP